MAKCGWCKETDLDTVPASSGKAGDATLEEHKVKGTGTTCDGPTTYNQLNSDGVVAKS